MEERGSGKFPVCKNRVITTHLISAAWDKVCSKADILKCYFTNTICVMKTYGEDDSLI